MTIFRFVNRDMVGASHDVVCPISQAKPNFNIDLVSKKTTGCPTKHDSW